MMFKEISQKELLENRQNIIDKNLETINLINKVNEILDFTKNINVKSLFRKLNKIKYDNNGKVVDSALFKILFPKNENRGYLEDLLGVQLDENCEIFDSPNLELETFNINNFYKLFE